MKTVISYLEAEEYLNDVPKFSQKNPMEKTKKFYEYLQNETDICEKKLGKIIHIAGTNGKGSVCAYLDSIYRESGYKVGMFSSPHLITTRERFKINGEMISEQDFLEAFNWLERTIDIYNEQEEYIPTYFERLFFMMLYVFSKNNLDITVLETGLGGRLDTTNVINHPVVCVITEIGLDHMVYLGDTIEKIAMEKAGIIKTGTPVVYVDRKKESSDCFERTAREKKTSCHKVSTNEYKINEIQKNLIDFSVLSRYYDYIRININSCAIYQVENAAIAIKAVEVLATSNVIEVQKNDLIKGIENMKWPGRMEEIRPGVYIDGAHNEDGIEAFVNSVKETNQGQKAHLLFSAVNDKMFDRMIQMITQIECVEDFVITRIPGYRGVDVEDLKVQFERFTDKDVMSFESIEDAFSYIMNIKKENEVVYVVGSLYLAGIIEEILANK